MFGSEILEVAIGLMLVYLLLSLICSAVREGLEAWSEMRAVHLERGIRELLQDLNGTGLAKALYTHPLIYGLFQNNYDSTKIKKNGLMPAHSNFPSYIPAGNFAVALLDIVARGPLADPNDANAISPCISLATLRASIGNIQSVPVQRALLSAIDMAQNDLNQARANIEAWYNRAMDRVSGWYKRRTQTIIFAIGLVATVSLNINTITIAQYLAQDNARRNAVLAVAETMARDPTTQNADIQSRYANLAQLGLPIGWADSSPVPTWVMPVQCEGRCYWWYSIVVPIFGWMITAFAITLGAPFWFDLLNKFMVIRSTVKPHEKSPEEASEDRQRPAVQLTQGTQQMQLQVQALSFTTSVPVRPHGSGNDHPQGESL
jgi:hypothetical protein